MLYEVITVEGTIVDRNPGVLGVVEQFLRVFEPKIPIQRKYIQTWRHRIFRRNVFQLKDVLV